MMVFKTRVCNASRRHTINVSLHVTLCIYSVHPSLTLIWNDLKTMKFTSFCCRRVLNCVHGFADMSRLPVRRFVFNTSDLNDVRCSPDRIFIRTRIEEPVTFTTGLTQFISSNCPFVQVFLVLQELGKRRLVVVYEQR